MTPTSVLLVLLQVCSLQLMVVAMPTCLLDGDRVQSAYKLLMHLGGDFPVTCVSYNTNISFPRSAFPAATANHAQCRRALWVVHESLEKTWDLFEDHELPVAEGGVTWDNKTLDNFRNLQSQLLEQGSCLSSVDRSGVLSPYFRNVAAVIEEQAACGWMALKRDLLRVLETTLKKHKTCFTWRSTH